MMTANRRDNEQTLTLTHVCSQFGDLAFGPKAGTQQAIRMKTLQPLRIARDRKENLHRVTGGSY
jgi:hypothetical protein